MAKSGWSVLTHSSRWKQDWRGHNTDDRVTQQEVYLILPSCLFIGWGVVWVSCNGLGNTKLFQKAKMAKT